MPSSAKEVEAFTILRNSNGVLNTHSVKPLVPHYSPKFESSSANSNVIIKSSTMLQLGSTIHVLPTLNDTNFEDDWMQRFIRSIDERTQALLQGMNYFSKVTYGRQQNKISTPSETHAEYIIQLSVNGVLGGHCRWGVDLYDQDGNLILTAMDDISSHELSSAPLLINFMNLARSAEYFKEKVPQWVSGLLSKITLTSSSNASKTMNPNAIAL